MNTPEIRHIIKETVQSFIPGARVLLFGSRARGQENQYSDYDVLVVTPDTLAPREKMDCETKIGKTLVHLIRAPFDVIVQSKNEIADRRNAKGHIIYYALKDAIEI